MTQRKDSGLKLFGARSHASRQILSDRKIETPVPVFLIVRTSFPVNFWSSLKIVLARFKMLPGKDTARLFRPFAAAGIPGRSLTLSMLLHGTCILFLIYLHYALPSESPRSTNAVSERIYYPLPVRYISKSTPRLAPAGPGGPHPGEGPKFAEPILGSTAKLKNLFAVSKPVRPDNTRQTIWQRSSPPNIRIQTEIKLPIILLGNPNIPKPAIKFNPSNAKPTRANKQYATESAPLEQSAQASLATNIMPTVAQPKLLIPAGTYATPIRSGSGHGQAQASGAPDVSSIPSGGDSNDLLAIGLDPGSDSRVVLPPGNRWGDFSVSPAGGQPGSPGGSPNGTVGGGGSGKEGTGGDGSVGIGRGTSGGGGGNATDSLPVSVSGGGEFTNGDGTLNNRALTTEEMIVPVAAPLIRRNETVVSSGPIGGGGLAEYNALTCGKIYTIFVKMPGKSWNLEYCPHGAEIQNSASADVRATVIHMEKALLPPQPTEKFDFLRLPVPEGKRRKLIVLKAVIGEDGVVSDVQVYRGLVPEMDEAARVALSRWKFMPAIRDGKPVAVDILVGIQSAPSEIH
jgi:hypothetical protein